MSDNKSTTQTPNRRCSFCECESPYYARGLCKQHYEQESQGRKNLGPIRRWKRRSRETFVIEYYERPSPYPELKTPCHISKRANSLLHRRTVHFKDGSVGIHKLAWERTFGKVPDGLFVCHKCDVPACCNVDHLFLGTAKDNHDDMVRKGRKRYGHRPKGYCGKPNKLTAQKVSEMRRRYANGEKQKDLAREFGIAVSGVSQIVLRKKWSHVV